MLAANRGFINEISGMASVPGPSVTRTFFSRFSVWLALFFVAPTSVRPTSGQNFSLTRTSYVCGSNVICLGGAHVYTGNNGKLDVGMLSLIEEDSEYAQTTTGMVYYKEPIRLLDPSSNQSASFSTSFEIEVVNNTVRSNNGPADGMAFVLSADNVTLGTYGRTLGIFNAAGVTPFKTIVVEFDEYENPGWPANDVDDNHVSVDFNNITAVNQGNARDSANVLLGDGQTTYARVDYNDETQQLEVSIGNSNVKPLTVVVTVSVDLFDVVEEYMWVGFTSGASFIYSNYYIGNWTFQSSGIPPESLDGSLPSNQVPSRLHPNWTVVGILVSLAFVLACAFNVISVIIWQHNRPGGRGWSKVAGNNYSLQLEGMPERFDYEELCVATRGFSKESKLGQGGSGSVYRGVLPSGIPVAVKRIDGDATKGEKEFMAEVSIISQLRHRNLIQLLGWCKDVARGNYLLVYELMPNGSLDKSLFGTFGQDTEPLSWPQRINIVTGAAAALDYLHQGWKQQVIHRDVKPSNIMLDENWNARLGDFGLARFVDHEREATPTLVAGTYGYIAPEVATSGKFTDKTDVFAFGAVVLEVVCGRKALSVRVPPDEMILVDWVWNCRSRGEQLSTVDKRLRHYDEYGVKMLLTVGLLCSHPDPLARPTMRHIVQILAGDAPLPCVPTSKPVAVYRSEFPSASNDQSAMESGHHPSFRSVPVSPELEHLSNLIMESTAKSGTVIFSHNHSTTPIDMVETG